MSHYLDELNPIQREAAANIEGPVLIVAGPGSGKTRVLTYRIAHLLESGAAPHQVLALTFTNKSAKEMKERIAKVVGEKAHNVWAGTFHSVFARMLRSDADRLGFPKDFTIYDSDDSKSLVSTIISELNLDPKIYGANDIRGRISSAKSNLFSPEGYLNDPGIQEQDKMAKRPFIGKIYQIYVNRCRKAGAMDFDDLLYQFYHLLNNHADIADRYRKRFKYVMVDEFQDTNHLQYEIVRKLVDFPGSTRNICVVGDDAQSIYAFRGATIQNILDFKNDFKGVQVFKLEQNYRSTSHIVAAANSVISRNSKQIQKKIWTDRTEAEPIKIIKALSDSEEGKRVADTIIEQKNRYRMHNSEIAILYRTNAQSRIFEESLRRYNLAYRVFGGLSFYQRKEVKDVLAYLRLICNPNDEEAFKRIINYPTRKIGKTSVDKLQQIANEQNISLWDVTASVHQYPNVGSAAAPIKGFALMIDAFKKRLASDAAHEIAAMVLKQSGIWNELKADQTPEGISRQENVMALLDGIKEFVEMDSPSDDPAFNDRSLSSYLQNIALLSDQDQNSDDTDRITLMSVHAAKGLEFKSVFVVGLEEGLFPSFMASQTPEGLDEERRLFYVAITRAEQYLTLTFATSRYKFGQHRNDPPSRFLEEVGSDNLEKTTPLASASQRSTVSGLGLRKPTAPPPPTINPADFKPAHPAAIKTGARILHLRFGEGEVLSIEGDKDNLIANILFKATDEEKKIVLKFAKLMLL
jgi:DNA helicase II / ATP-dependent DNA helicase PcrA